MKNLLKKIHSLRNAILALDWTPDDSYMMSTGQVKYVSIKKMKRQIAPLYYDVGIDFNFNMLEYSDNGSLTRVKMEIILTDIDTGLSQNTIVIAEAKNVNKKGEPNDKTMEIAQAYALRMYYTAKYHLIDGIEYDNEGESTESLLEAGSVRSITQTKITETPSTVSAPAPAVSGSVPSVPQLSKADESKVAPVTVAEQKVESIPAPASTGGGTGVKAPNVEANHRCLSKAEQKAVDNAFKAITEYHDEGKITDEQFDSAKSLWERSTNSTDVFNLMKMKGSLEKTIKTANPKW